MDETHHTDQKSEVAASLAEEDSDENLDFAGGIFTAPNAPKMVMNNQRKSLNFYFAKIKMEAIEDTNQGTQILSDSAMYALENEEDPE